MNYSTSKTGSRELDFEHQQLISIFDSIDEAIYVADPDSYEILYANRVLKSMLGDVKGKKCYEVLQNRHNPCPFCTNEHIFGENLGQSYIWDFQNEINGRWYHCIDKAIKWPDGQWVRYEMAIDITKQKTTEENLKKHRVYLENLVKERTLELEKVNEQLKKEIKEHKRKSNRILHLDKILKSILAINRLITYEKDKFKLLQSACDVLTQVYNYRMVWVGVIKNDHSRIVPVAQSGFEEGYLETIKVTWDDAPTSKGPTGTAIKTRKPSIMRDIQNDPRYEPWREPALQRGYRSSIAIPLISDEELYGVLNIYSIESDAFDEEEVELLTHVADDIAFALVTINVEEDRKRVEGEKSQLQHRLEALWKIARLVDEDYQSVCNLVLEELTSIADSPYAFYGFLNEAESVMNIYSWSKETVVDCQIQDKPTRFPISTAGLWADAVRLRRSLIINDYLTYPHKRGLPEGHLQLKRVLVVPIVRHGRILSVIAVANKSSDYTQADVEKIESFASNVQVILDHRKNEEELNRFSTAVRMSSDFVIITNKGGNITDVNEATVEFLGIEKDKLIGRNFTDLATPEEYKKVVFSFEEALKKGIIEKQEFGIITNDGSRAILETNMATMKDNEEELLGFIVISRDITARKNSEKELRKQLLKFNLEEGRLYLEKESTLIKSVEAFTDALKAGFKALIISRTPRNKFRPRIDNHFDHIWVTEKGSNKEDTISPDLDQIEQLIENLSSAKLILMDGLDYLCSKKGFKNTLSLVQHLREIAYLKDHIIILSMDPIMLSEREIKLLEKETSEIEPRHMAKLPDNLLRILKVIYTQNKLGTKLTYTEVEREVGISKPTARRRIRTLVNYGYLIESCKGRFKLLELTEKGRNLFLK